MHGLLPADAARAATDALAKEFGVRVSFSGADVTVPAEVAAMVARARADHGGRLDILCNNAGIQHVAPVVDFPVDRWDAILAVCLSAPFHATKAALPGMVEAGWGRVINTGSMHALVASPYKSAYNAAKHGVAGLTKTAALEVARTGVTVNAVCPGYVRTALVDRQIGDQARARGIPEDRVVEDVLLADQPTKRFVTVEEVGALVRFLCGDEAGSITGACLSIDGGWTAR
jgi:3-hydroxybutyrate dehydrogenase